MRLGFQAEAPLAIVFSRWTTPILWTLHTHGRQRFVELDGRSLAPLFAHLAEWATAHFPEVDRARRDYDETNR
ncbi:hypothetical protein [Streptomyces sp. ISL-99]|uniref:hypothetical protein n=1 Tax=Streptomyces sp. ISL-99 TaxID=2819193 RepID=UPI0020359EC9